MHHRKNKSDLYINSEIMSFRLLIVLFCSCFINAQPIPYKKGNVWGYATTEGKIIIEPKYDSVSVFNTNSDTYAQVYQNAKCGIINQNGKIVVPIEFSYIDFYYPNFIVKNNTEKYGLYKPNVGFIIPAIYNRIEYAKYDTFLVEKTNKIGIIDYTGTILIPVMYDQIHYIDYRNNSLKFKVVNDTETQYKIVTVSEDEATKTYLVQEVATSEIEDIETVEVNSTKDDFNLDNLAKKYDRVYPVYRFRNNLLFTVKNGKYGFVNVESKNEITPKYDTEPTVLLKMYNSKTRTEENYLTFTKNGKVGLVFEDGTEIIPAKYDKITGRNQVIYLENNTKTGFYFIKTKILIEPKYAGKLNDGFSIQPYTDDAFTIIPVYLDNPKNWFYIGQNAIEFKE
ncbi:WG repeat-containing protein [Flavobacterium sp.]|uniref:WG repeat-containing protein n=1 Tax=Flavobacterium sp. TaxID=239 RepID=UPI003528C81F